MIKSPAICDADVWIKMTRIERSDLIFKTFEEVNMAGVVVREIRQFQDCNNPKNTLDKVLNDQKIIMVKQKDFNVEKMKSFKYLIAEYQRRHHVSGRKSLGEIVSAILAQELKIPIIVSDDSLSKKLSEEFDLHLYDHYYILDHCENFNFITKKEADLFYRQIEKLGHPKKQSRDILKKLKKAL